MHHLTTLLKQEVKYFIYFSLLAKYITLILLFNVYFLKMHDVLCCLLKLIITDKLSVFNF